MAQLAQMLALLALLVGTGVVTAGTVAQLAQLLDQPMVAQAQMMVILQLVVVQLMVLMVYLMVVQTERLAPRP